MSPSLTRLCEAERFGRGGSIEMKYLKLSYNIAKGMPLYPGTPGVRIEPFRQIKAGDAYNTYMFTMQNHTGTHVDAPRHFWDNGRSLADYSLDELEFKRPLIVDCPRKEGEIIGANEIASSLALLGTRNDEEKEAPRNDSKGRNPINDVFDVLLIRTGFGAKRETDIRAYRYENPCISPDAAEWIRKNLPALGAIGVDCISIASKANAGLGRDAHRILLGEGVFKGLPLLIIEDMRIPAGLKKLDRLLVTPLFIDGVDSSPCTITGIVND